MRISDIKKAEIASADNMDSVWYITKQNQSFADLCYMSHILEDWNNDEFENYESFFNRSKTKQEYGSLSENTPHRATINCVPAGLLTTNDPYNSDNLTPLYYSIKERCNANFANTQSYQDLINNQLQSFVLRVNNNNMNPLLFLLKILLQIGDATGEYKITINEFKLFVATTSLWKDYFKVRDSILRYREDSVYKNECDSARTQSVQDVRIQKFLANHEFIETEGKELVLQDQFIMRARKLVANFEVNGTTAEQSRLTYYVNGKDATLNKDVVSYLSAIRTKPFLLLAGISGTGKSRIVRKLAQATTTAKLENCDEQTLNNSRWDLHKPANFEIIQVKPNWHNSMDVVGYQTNIPTPRYVFTPFVEFIAKAWQHPTVPFFLCLDEMNLAPVEEYFAEFLSAIESRSKKGNTYETDPIIKPFKDFNYENEQGKKCSLAEDMVNLLLPGYNAGNMPQHIIELSKRFKEKGLTLPENLVVIGTVNMDETTFSFSRKVLDRAMSFEMNEVDYDSFLEDTADIITEPLTAKASTLLVDRPIKAQDVKDKVDADFIVSYLKAVNEKLDNTPFKLGYRAANEAMLYVAASKSFGQDSIATALDEFTTMKILSRIEGDTTKLRVDDNSDKTILDELETVTKDFLKPANKLAVHQEEQPAEENANGEDNAPVKDVVVAAPVELKSLDKIKRMKEQLKRNSFVSYWD